MRGKQLRETWVKAVPDEYYWDLWWCRWGSLITFAMGTIFGIYMGGLIFG